MNELPAATENGQQNGDHLNSGEKGYKPDSEILALLEELQAIAPTVDGKTRADLEKDGYSFLEGFILSNGENGHIKAEEIKRIIAVLHKYPEVNKTHKYAIVLSSDKDSGKHEQKYEVMMKAKDASEIPEITFEERAEQLEAAVRENAIARDVAPKTQV